MKTQELLKLYKRGRRDFRGHDLRGLSFEGKDLSGADFSKCDIRGTNFSRANLTGAKFVEAKAGLQKQWVIGLFIFCYLLSAFAGLFISILVAFITLIFSNEYNNMIMGWISIFITFSLNLILIYRGFKPVAYTVGFPIRCTVRFAVTYIVGFPIAYACCYHYGNRCCCGRRCGHLCQNLRHNCRYRHYSNIILQLHWLVCY